MKIAQTSDTHENITKKEDIKKMLLEMAKEDFDIILHNGDFSGGVKGYKSVDSTVKLIREIFPDKPFVAVLGNHDYWHVGTGRGTNSKLPSMTVFNSNYRKILKTFKNNNVHFLDEDGLYQHLDFPDVILTGHSGWYKNLNPPTNDCNFLPYEIEGNTNKWLENKARKALYEQLGDLDKLYDSYRTICFVSHFPVVNSVADHKGSFADFCWDEKLQDLMQTTYNCKHFFCGHSHKLVTGPLRYEAGSDYYNPQYHIVEV